MRLKIRGKIIKFPDFLIVGAARSGTTFLYNYLRQHPQVFVPTVKEPEFLAFGEGLTCFSYPKREIHWKLAAYTSLFERAKEDQVIGEVSPIYLYLHQKTIRNIKKYFEHWRNIKIVIMLRNPVERTWSHYLFHKLRFEETLDPKSAFDLSIRRQRMRDNWHPWYDYIGYSLYYQQVKNYLDNFPYVKVCLFEDLRDHADGLMKDIFTFLEVDDSFTSSIALNKNPSGSPKFKLFYKYLMRLNHSNSLFCFMKSFLPWEIRRRALDTINLQDFDTKVPQISKDTASYLRRLYREDVLTLQNLVGRDLSTWLV